MAWPIHVGNDFPDAIAEHLRSWDTSLLIERESDMPSTRGLLEYQDTTIGRAKSLLIHTLLSRPHFYESNSMLTEPARETCRNELTLTSLLDKSFKYTTPVLAVQENKLQDTALLTSKVYHYLASPQDMKTRVLDLLALREQGGILDRPLIIWEPAPLSCKPEKLEACLEAAALVDVFTPNHLELAAFFEQSPVASFNRSEIEMLGSKFLASGVGPEGKGAVVIRAGENGCFVQSRDIASQWLPPFYTADMAEEHASKVVDPTGAGNAFLGGYAIGYLQRRGNILEAACYGSVAASFALEQVGMPEKSNGRDEELWNGVSVGRRLHQYMARQESLQ